MTLPIGRAKVPPTPARARGFAKSSDALGRAIAYEAAMKMVEIASFEVAHGHLPWPWIAVDPTRHRFAFVSGAGVVESRVLVDGSIAEGPRFTLPADLGLPTKPVDEGTDDGIRALAIDPSGHRIAVLAYLGGAPLVVSIDSAGQETRTKLESIAGGEYAAHAIVFDRTGARLWISATSSKESALALVEAAGHAVVGVVRTAPFALPGQHELHVHAQDDAVLLLVSGGQDGTFARVAGWSDGPPEAVPTALDAGSTPAGFVGFSADGARVHLAEVFELRTHAWPGLEELSSVELAIDFESTYSGAVLGNRIFVDGHDSETGEYDSVMVFDRSAIRGAELKPPVPEGMWVGKLGSEMIVTVEAKGEPARGRVVLLPEWEN